MSKKSWYKFNENFYETMDDAETAVSSYAEETYDDYLDSEGDIYICGLPYSPSKILKGVDEIAYRCFFGDYESFLMEEIEEVEVVSEIVNGLTL